LAGYYVSQRKGRLATDVQIKITATGATHIGLVRSTNQDSLLIDEDMQLYIVADGMGGHAGGEIASSLCVNSISQFLRQQNNLWSSSGERQHPDARISNAMANAINHASTKIYERALEEPSLRGMGTTATAVVVVDKFAYVAHVGDSRCYLLRRGFIYQVTNDHSLVSEQVRAGILTKEEADLHHLRNVITRSVGYQEEEDVDTTSLALEDGDLLLLCSDGLHGKVSDKELSGILSSHETNSPDKLIASANERGGEDNITAVTLKISFNPPSPTPAT
jgi:protein phosphatase